MIRQSLESHLIAMGILIPISWIFWGGDVALATVWGSFLSGLNLLGTVWAWQKISLGRGTILAACVIVNKYAILGLAIFVTLHKEWVPVNGFLIGLGSLVLSICILAYKSRKLFEASEKNPSTV